MLKIIYCFLFIIFAITSVGCSTLYGKNSLANKRATEYQRSQGAPSLQIPTGVNANNVGNDYPVPPAEIQLTSGPANLLPPGSMADKVNKGELPAAVLKNEPVLKKSKPKSVVKPAASNTQTDSTTKVTTALDNSNTPTLTLTQNTMRMWSSIGSSLKQAGYGIANENQKTGIYYLLDVPSTDNKVTKETPIYQLHLRDTENGSVASLTDNEGKEVPTTIAQRILTDLNNALNGKGPSPVSKWLKNLF